MIFPFVWMVISALKTKAEVMDTSKFFPTHAQWSNFASIFTDSPLLKYVGNSLFVAVVTLALQLIFEAMIAYAIVFIDFKGRKLLFAVIMGTYMLPTAATYIPSYIILADMNLLNTFTGLIISNCVSIFGIFLLRQAFMQVPMGLIEAARIDGANQWKILWRIVAPMTKSSFITFGLMNFITCYNSYLIIYDSEGNLRLQKLTGYGEQVLGIGESSKETSVGGVVGTVKQGTWKIALGIFTEYLERYEGEFLGFVNPVYQGDPVQTYVTFGDALQKMESAYED